MTATITELGRIPSPATEEAQTALERAVEAMKDAQAKVVAEAMERIEEADQDAADAMAARDNLQAQMEDRLERMGGLVLGTAERLHDQARHPGTLRFCTAETCTAWTDLARVEGWGS